jgi:signal peptidase I
MRPGSEFFGTGRELVLVFLAIGLLVRADIWAPVLIAGNSMSPSLHAGQIAGLNKLSYRLRPPHRGDVVAVWTGKALIVKRIIGLPGEEIYARDGTFFINGQALQEPYIRFQDHWSIGPGRIPAGQFVVVGDNRPQTLLAIVARERIVGRLMQ